MKIDDLLSMAREAGFRTGKIDLTIGEPIPFIAPASATSCLHELENFAALVEHKTVQEIAANCAKRGITFCTDRMSVALASPRVAIPAGLSAEEIRQHIISAGVQAEATK